MGTKAKSFLKDKLRVFYISSLLVLGALLVLFAQGVFSGLSTDSGEQVVEINRIDLFDYFLGNYSKISVMIINNNTISHNYTIDTFYGETLKDSYNITVEANRTFHYQRDVVPEDISIFQNETINSTLRVARFVVYMDEQSEPFEEASFVFNN
ncbi:MAG: hypothetical protein KK926_05905 [Methanomethylovorans sp.]|nr:hypothetical protein [Methanomethylovorans sp.]